jgi:hypothetical protein
MSDVRLSTVPCLKGSLLDLGIGTAHIKVFGMLNSFRPELKIKPGKLEKWGSFTVEGLTKTFCRSVHLRRVDFYKPKVNTVLKQIVH